MAWPYILSGVVAAATFSPQLRFDSAMTVNDTPIKNIFNASPDMLAPSAAAGSQRLSYLA